MIKRVALWRERGRGLGLRIVPEARVFDTMDTPGAPVFYGLGASGNLNMSLLPVLHGEKVRMRGGRLADVCVCRRPSP